MIFRNAIKYVMCHHILVVSHTLLLVVILDLRLVFTFCHLQASELRYTELITQVPESTRPLLRQIEAMQVMYFCLLALGVFLFCMIDIM